MKTLSTELNEMHTNFGFTPVVSKAALERVKVGCSQ